MAIFFFKAYSAFYSLLSLHSSMIPISFSTVLSTSQNSFPSLARQRAHRYLISVLFKFSMQRRQKEWPHSRLMGWIISSKQMEQVNYWVSRHALSHRQLIFLLCCLLTIFFFSYLLLKRDLRSFLVTLCNRALQIFFPVPFSAFWAVLSALLLAFLLLVLIYNLHFILIIYDAGSSMIYKNGSLNEVYAVQGLLADLRLEDLGPLGLHLQLLRELVQYKLSSLVQIVVITEFDAEGDGQGIIFFGDELRKLFNFHELAVAPTFIDVELRMMLFHNIQLLVVRVYNFYLIDVEVERIWVVDELKEDGDVLRVGAAFRVQHQSPLTFFVKHQLAVIGVRLVHSSLAVVDDYPVGLERRDCLLNH